MAFGFQENLQSPLGPPQKKTLSFCYLRGFTETSQESTSLISAPSLLLARALQTCSVLCSSVSLVGEAWLHQSWGGTRNTPPSGGLQVTWSTTRQHNSFLFSCLFTLL